MNKAMCMLAVFVFLTGCGLPLEWEQAALNYAKANCEGKLLGDVRFMLLDGTIETKFFWDCIDETGVVHHNSTLNKIPLKYWTEGSPE